MEDLSIISLILNADPVVQAIIAGLVLASIACWAIIIEKIVRLAGLRGEIRTLEQIAGGRRDLPKGGVARMVVDAGRREQADVAGTPASVSDYEPRQRIDEAMRIALTAQLRRLEGGMSLLATIASATPFVGLFGTVWGIMNSFTSIAASQNTSLEVVAPGIAEALFATAAGLAAAIPAVIAYNLVSNSLGQASRRGGEAIAVLARDLFRELRPQPRS